MKQALKIVPKMPAGIDLDRLSRMRPNEIKALHRTLFGRDVVSSNAEQARRRIAWHLQAEREGGLPESARQHALGLARESGMRLRSRIGGQSTGPLAHVTVTTVVSDHDSRIPLPGSVIVKEHRGRTILVHVLDDGFEWDSRRFPSLSAIAKEATGTKWNGFAFFGLAKGGRNG